MHKNGEGVEVDLDKAFQLFKLAAAQGDSKAQANLAEMYEKGWGTPVDKEAALLFYQKSAEKDNPRAKAKVLNFREEHQ